MVLYEYTESKKEKTPFVLHCKNKGKILDDPEGFILCSKSSKTEKIYHKVWSNDKGEITVHIIGIFKVNIHFEYPDIFTLIHGDTGFFYVKMKRYCVIAMELLMTL